MTDCEKNDRAVIAGLDPAFVSEVQGMYGDAVVDLCVSAVQRAGLRPATVQELVLAGSPALLSLFVHVVIGKQSSAPLGNWSARVMSDDRDDAFGGRQLLRGVARHAIAEARGRLGDSIRAELEEIASQC